MSGRGVRRWLVRLVVSSLVGLAWVAAPAGPVGATTLQSTVLSPVDGSVSSNPDEPHHRSYGGDYSFDVQTSGQKRPVYARFRNTNGSLSLSVAAVGRACASGSFADGGDRVVLNVVINGAKVGTVTYGHLANIRYASGAVPVGAHIGDVATGADGVIARSGNGCWTGPHVHIEPRNDVKYGCFFRLPLGAGAGSSTPLGIIGGERAAGVNALCPAGAEVNVTPMWDASFVDQSAYVDAGLTQSWDLAAAYPGQEGWLRFRVRNTGSQTWSSGGSNPVRLGTADPRDRASGSAVTGSWLSTNRAAAVSPASVPPGAVGTFLFRVRVPNGTGSLRETFQMVAEGASWFGPVMWRDFGRPAWAGTYVDQSAFADAGLTQAWNLGSAYPGQEGWFRFRVRNTGSQTWSSGGSNPVRLGTADPRDRASALSVAGYWFQSNRPAVVSPASVPPGAVGTFLFKVRVPAGTGTFRESFQVVADGASWLGPVMWRDIARNAPPVDPNPFGSFDSLSAPAAGQVRLRGWAIDLSTPTSPIQVAVVVGGPLGTEGAESRTIVADRRRDDVAVKYSGTGSSHGFDAAVATSKSGDTTVCAYAVNTGVGQSQSLGCKSVNIPK